MTKYISKAAFTRAVQMAKASEIAIGGFELFPDGRIRFMTPEVVESQGREVPLYDRLKREGRL